MHFWRRVPLASSMPPHLKSRHRMQVRDAAKHYEGQEEENVRTARALEPGVSPQAPHAGCPEACTPPLPSRRDKLTLEDVGVEIKQHLTTVSVEEPAKREAGITVRPPLHTILQSPRAPEAPRIAVAT